jgi:hypothetical protein
MRRWVMSAARGETFVTMEVLQKAINKWLPRGLEMFGDERGGGTNVRLGLKPMKNSEAQRQYYDEVSKLVRDLNLRYLRARIADLTHASSEAALDRILAGETVEGVRREDLLHIPHMDFFRRRGVPSFRMVGDQGETFATVSEYLQHLVRTLPESYRASRDYKDYVIALTDVYEGRMTAEQAAGKMPALRRVAGACPCSKSVRWMVDDPSVISAVSAPEPAVGQPVA